MGERKPRQAGSVHFCIGKTREVACSDANDSLGGAGESMFFILKMNRIPKDGGGIRKEQTIPSSQGFFTSVTLAVMV